jgi:hypothetical protein
MAASNQPGIIVTQAGVSARYAADYQMVFNSNWPSLQTAFDTTVTMSPNSTQTIPHGLNIFPFTVGTVIQNGISLGRIFAKSQSFDVTPPSTVITLSFDKTNVYLANTDLVNSYQVNVKCHNLDISKAVDYTLPAPPILKTPYDPTTGIKVNKYAKSNGSTDLRDFILHSRCQSPAVLSIVTQDSAYYGQPSGTFYTYDIIYANPVAYLPWAFAFYNDGGGKYVCLAPGAQNTAPAFFVVNQVENYATQVNKPSSLIGRGAVLNFQDTLGPGLYTKRASLVVLRDPLVVANTLQVTYNG